MKRLLLTLSAVFVIALAPIVSVSKSYAAPPSTTITLSTVSSVNVGSTINIGIYTNSADPIYGGDVYVSYPTASFSYVGVVNSPAFSIDAGNTNSNGTVQMSKANLTAQTDTQLFATLQLKAIAGSGTATIRVTNATKIAGPDYPSVNYFSGTPSVAISLTGATTPTPSTPVTSTPTPTPTKTTPAKTTTVPKPTPALPLVVKPAEDKTPPVISDIQVSDITTGTATISWKTSEPATSQVMYGIGQEYGLTAGDLNLVADHKVTLSDKILTPGTDFYYMIQSADAAGNVAKAENQTFHTTGGTITLTVLDAKKHPLSGAKVSFGSLSGVTNDKGQVTISGIGLGKLTGTIEYKGKKTKTSLLVTSLDSNGAAAAATLTAATPSSSTGLAAVLVVLMLVAAIVVWRGRSIAEKLRGGGSGGAADASVNKVVVGGQNKSLFGNPPASDITLESKPAVQSAAPPAPVVTPPAVGNTNNGNVIQPTTPSSTPPEDKNKV